MVWTRRSTVSAAHPLPPRLTDARCRAQMGEQALGDIQRVRKKDAGGLGRPRGRLERADALEDAPLGLFADSLDRAGSARLAGRLEIGDGLDPELGRERRDLLEAEIADPVELARARGANA